MVTAKVSFTPDKISILSKPCRYSGRQVSCFKAKVCFSATFKPANPLGPAGNDTNSDRAVFYLGDGHIWFEEVMHLNFPL